MGLFPSTEDPLLGVRGAPANRFDFRHADRLFWMNIWAVSTLLLAVVCVFLLTWALGEVPAALGIRPRQPWGWVGIFTSVFVHADWEHLVANLLSLGLSTFILLSLYPTVALRVSVWVALVGGLLVFVFGRCCTHVGASGLIYGIESFLLISGLIRQDKGAVAATLLVVFASPGILWGMSPLQPSNVSWEGHLYGALVGAVLAVWFRRYDRPVVKRYSWEDEPEPDEPHTNFTQTHHPNIAYEFVEKDAES